MALSSAVIAVTAVLTLATLFVTAAMAGPGFLLYLAMLGGAAAWLLPALVAQALPCGLFGGAMVAAAGPRPERRAGARAIVAATGLATLLLLGTVGWLTPHANQATAARSDRFRGPASAQRPAPPAPSALELPALASEPSEAARVELRRRLQPVGLVFILGLIASGFAASRLVWSTRAALALTAILFAIQTSYWVKSFPV